MSGSQTCPSCDKETFFIKEGKYDGFKKVAEIERCVSCGYILNTLEVAEIKIVEKPTLFSKDDLPETVKVFDKNDTPEFCRHCHHYTINPFTQYCGLHNRNVEATNSCADFLKKP